MTAPHHTPTLARRAMLRHATTLGLAGLSLSRLSVSAEPLPAHTSIVVGFPPGAGPDIVARLLAQQLTGRLAASVTVDNRSGAAGIIAVNTALAQPPNGTTLLFNPSNVVTLYPHTYRRLGFSPLDDLTPISLISRYELGLAIGPAVPETVRDIAALSAWVRQQGHSVAYGSPGSGSGLHFAGYVFASQQKLDMTHVPYRGAGPLITDLMGGHLAIGMGSLPALMAKAGAGSKLRILACTGTSRSRYFPSIATFEEQGVHGLPMREWHAVYIAGKPTPDTLGHLVPIVRAAVKHPAFIEAAGKQGFEAMDSSPQELETLAREDHARWGVIVNAAGFVAADNY